MAETIVMIDPRVLKDHPRNSEFFDDVQGEEFERLVESIKAHGVLTPVRVTKDMTIISGHQRKKAAIKAECFSVPAIIDETEDDSEVLMKLIETNFSRMNNNPIKQARWIKEYEELKGIRQGSAGGSQPNNSAGITQKDIAKELGLSCDTLQNLKKLLQLDPTLQQYISDGKISATTGFKLLTKLTPEEQQKLIDKLPDEVKFTASTIEQYIAQIREEVAKNAANVQKENDKLRGRNEQLIRENNELLAGHLPASTEITDRLAKLEQDNRDAYESMQRAKKEVERLQGELHKAIEAKTIAEKKAAGGDDGMAAMQKQIDDLEWELQGAEDEKRKLETLLSERDSKIIEYEREKNNKILRSAITSGDSDEEYKQREIDTYVSRIQGTITSFCNAIDEMLVKCDILGSVKTGAIGALVDTSKGAIEHANRLYNTLLSYTNGNEDATPEDDDFENEWLGDDIAV